MPCHSRVRLRAGLLFIALSVALPAAAQTRSDKASAANVAPGKKATTLKAITVQGRMAPGYTVDESSAATGLPLTLQDTPQSISVITAQRMTDQNLTTVRDVLDNTIGVESNAYDTERAVFWSRGFMIENMAYDGVPVASSINAQSVDGTLDTSIFERIDVVRGATGLLSGAGSPSAMVDFVRKHADSRTPQADVTLSYGSYGDRRISADGSTPLNASGSVRGRLVVTHEDGNSYLDRYHSWKNVFYGTIDADLGPGTLLSAGYAYQKTKPTGVTWGTFPAFYSDGTPIHWPRGFNGAADWTYWNNTTQTTFLQLKHRFDNGWKVQAEVDHQKIGSDQALFYDMGFPDRVTGAGVSPYAYKAYEQSRQNMVNLYATGPFQAFGREQQLVAGFYGSDYYTDTYYYPVVGELPGTGDFLDWTGDYPYPDFAAQTQFSSYSRIKQQGLYAATRLSLADPLKLVVGARYSTWKNATVDTSAGNSNDSQSKVLPYAGLIYAITPTYSAYASYTKIFDPQTYRYEDGAYIEPMVGSSREIGLKGRHFDGALNTSLTFFDERMSNVAEAIPGVYLPNSIIQAYTSYNGTESRGFELEVTGKFTERWNGTFGWSHFNIKAPGQGAIHTALPRVLVRAFTTYQLPGSWSRLTVGGGINWQDASKAPVTGPVTTEYVRQSSVTLLSAMVRYAFNDHASLQINGNNLLNRKYFVLDDYSDLYYAPPAMFMASFDYKFF